MNTIINTNQKKKSYNTPRIEIVKLDNEISLAMESLPPGYDNEGAFIPNNNTDPYKTNVG